MPDLEAGNTLAMQLEYLAEAESAGAVRSARAPIVLTSQSDSVICEIGTEPRLHTQDAKGATLIERRWAQDETLRNPRQFD